MQLFLSGYPTKESRILFHRRSVDFYKQARNIMVERQLINRGIHDRKVLDALSKVPRHLFVPETLEDSAYEDMPLPIGSQQTISQPYIVALMTEALQLSEEDNVLEIGTGSGYQAAVGGDLQYGLHRGSLS